MARNDSFWGDDIVSDFFGAIADLFGFPSASVLTAVGIGGESVDEAIGESMIVMESMAGNAGQEALVDELSQYWEGICQSARDAGGEGLIIAEAEATLGRDYAQGIQEIIAEGAAIVGEAIEAEQEARNSFFG